TDLTLPGKQQQLVWELKKLGKPMVLVLFNGRGLEITGIEKDFDAILDSFYPGSQGTDVIAKILHGDINPSGKLSVTFPRHSSQCPVYYGFHAGGGYYSVAPKDFFPGFNQTQPPLYCFGHGLSYTSFEYSNLQMDQRVGIDDIVHISFDVKNTGELCGDEVPMVFFRTLNPSINRPVKELRGFSRITLQPGETKRVSFAINTHTLGYYNADNRFVIEPAVNAVYVGGSSDRIALTGQFEIVGTEKEIMHERTYLFDCTVS
ncbi:MAG: glycoside hydrolase family 3 C-terminal domain-containing protein, partial [Erysipelotrichaceae bacterium]|nr:glycoside hydrolase family 3 C-terminal domain-containing protein [Erysipelotrichaceae bacterium]